MEFVAQTERSEKGEYGSVSVVNNNGDLIDLAVTPTPKIARILKQALDALVEHHDELLMQKINDLGSDTRF